MLIYDLIYIYSVTFISFICFCFLKLVIKQSNARTDKSQAKGIK